MIHAHVAAKRSTKSVAVEGWTGLLLVKLQSLSPLYTTGAHVGCRGAQRQGCAQGASESRAARRIGGGELSRKARLACGCATTLIGD
jgi:hypothetical protein